MTQNHKQDNEELRPSEVKQNSRTLKIDVVSVFPEMIENFVGISIPKRAVESGALEVSSLDLRDFSENKHRTVDAYPYGGGGGMVLKPGPFFRAHRKLSEGLTKKPFVVQTSARGVPLSQSLANELAEKDHLVIFCGHYKGIDARVDELCDLEVSIGDYCLSGGEVAACVLIDVVARLLPGVVGCFDSVSGDSHYHGLLGPPEFTRPESFEGREIPDILLSGHHQKIKDWRLSQAEELTRVRRPDLWEKYSEKTSK